jgi:hypothetical protein
MRLTMAAPSRRTKKPVDQTPGTPQSAAQQAERVAQAPGDAVAARRAATPAPQPDEAEIRRRAYEMYLERGGADGADFDDWLRAERELTKKE